MKNLKYIWRSSSILLIGLLFSGSVCGQNLGDNQSGHVPLTNAPTGLIHDYNGGRKSALADIMTMLPQMSSSEVHVLVKGLHYRHTPAELDLLRTVLHTDAFKSEREVIVVRVSSFRDEPVIDDAVSILIECLKNSEPGTTYRASIVGSLAQFRTTNAVAALRELLKPEAGADSTLLVLRALAYQPSGELEGALAVVAKTNPELVTQFRTEREQAQKEAEKRRHLSSDARTSALTNLESKDPNARFAAIGALIKCKHDAEVIQRLKSILGHESDLRNQGQILGTLMFIEEPGKVREYFMSIRNTMPPKLQDFIDSYLKGDFQKHLETQPLN